MGTFSVQELERLADGLLTQELKNSSKDKIRHTEYSFLSDSQLKRRQSMEIPMSSLSNRQKLECLCKRCDQTFTEGV